MRDGPLRPEEFASSLAEAIRGRRFVIDCSGEGPELTSALEAVADAPTAANIRAARAAFTTQQTRERMGGSLWETWSEEHDA